MASSLEPARRRIVSLDQYRGYTVAGMLLVNFVGGFAVVKEYAPLLKHHNTYNSYADTIMPQFFFAVGFAYRLTFLRRRAAEGTLSAVWAAIVRNLGLILLGVIVYHLDGEAKTWADLERLGVGGFFAQAFRREMFQTLVHIALTSLWILPVIGRGTSARVVFMVASAVIHLGLSRWFYLDYARHVIDGGPLGFLTWAIPTLVGSFAYDTVSGSSEGGVIGRLLGWSLVLMSVGYGLSCAGGELAPPPFIAPSPSHRTDLWTMSQRTGASSYQFFAAGFSLAVYALFVQISDRWGFRIGLFSTFGQNALVTYVVHSMVASAVKPYAPDDSPWWYVTSAFLIYFAITYAFIRYLERNGIFIRL